MLYETFTSCLVLFLKLYICCGSIYPWFKFYFPLFLGMVMYYNEFKTKEKKFEPRLKLNHNIYITKLHLILDFSETSRTFSFSMTYEINK